MKFVSVIFFGLLLAACQTTKGSGDDETACIALDKPYTYNPVNKESSRHAGPALAKDLKRHNQTFDRLHCPRGDVLK